MPDRIGLLFGEYYLDQLIGKGGFAEVYRGKHRSKGTFAAVKVLNARLTNENVKHFLNEARSFRLKHPNIISLLDFGLEDDYPYLVMEYTPNGSLRQRYPKGTRLPLETIVPYVKQVASALQYAHEEGIVHRDVKPDNMLLGQNNRILLSDFGIASIAHTTNAGNILDQAGTITYMAPEQLLGKPRPATDQYALAVVVYEWLCGERPFQGTYLEIHSQHLSAPPPSLRSRIPSLSADIESVVMTALEKDSHLRFTTIQAFAHALEQACKPVAPSAPLPSGGVKIVIPDTPHIDASPQPSQTEPPLPLVFQKEAALSFTLPVEEQANASPGKQTVTLKPEDALDENISPAPITKPRDTPFQSPEKVTYLPDNTPVEHFTGMPSPVAEVRARPAIARDFRNSHIAPKKRAKTPIRLLALVVLALIAISAVVFASPIGQRLFATTSGVSITPTLTITPKSSLVSDNFVMTGVTSTPDPAKRQVSARVLTYSSPKQSQSANATGSIPGRQATGTLLFQNTGGSGVTIASTTLKGASGVPVTFNGPVFVPATGTGTVSVTGYAINVGPGGNIPALDIVGPCCASGITVKNTTAFSGGQDPQMNTVIQQSDIDGAVNALKPGAQKGIDGQVKPGEQALPSTLSCKPNVTADHRAGDIAKSVTVKGSVTCTEEVYDAKAATALATSLLQTEAKTDPGTHYALVGSVIAGVTQATPIDAHNTVSLLVHAEGVWVYQFSEAEKTLLKNAIANKKKSDAQTYLQLQPGVSSVSIAFNGDVLPGADQITIVVKMIPGVSGSPSMTTGGPVSGSPTAASTPTSGLGGA